MRPIKLVMNAFGPYKGKVEIDFMKLRDKSLFLITGPTGAGKSTIFDAITFALYGKGNLEGRGYEKDSKSFKSDFAGIEEESYVEFDFEVKGKPYNIKRYPAQEVKKLRGEGTRDKSEEAILSYRDVDGDTVFFERLNEIRDEIEVIIGLTVEQFRQIMMIPQGQFKKVISSDTKERKDILQKLFDISICSKVQEGLKISAREKEREIKDIERIIESLFDTLNNEVAREVYVDSDLEKRIAFYTGIKEKNADKITELDKSLKVVDGEISELNQVKGRVELINNLIDDKENKEKELESLLTKEEEYEYKEKKHFLGQKALKVREKEKAYLDVSKNMKLAEELIKKLEKELIDKKFELRFIETQIELGAEERAERNSLVQEISNLESMREAAGELESINDEANSLKKEMNKIKARDIELTKENELIDSQLVDQDKLEQEKNNDENSLKELKDEEHKLELKDEILKNINSMFNDLNNVVKDFKLIKSDLNNKSEKIKEYELEYNKLEKQYVEISNQYNSQIVDRLRSNLKDGDSCPVCGSTEHISFDKEESDTQVTEEDLEEAEKIRDKKKALLDIEKNEYVQLKTRFEESANRGSELTQRITQECISNGIAVEEGANYNTLKKQMLIYSTEQGSIRSKNKKEINAIKARIVEMDNLLKKNRDSDKKFRENQKTIQFLREEYTELKLKLNEIELKLKSDKEKIFGSEKESVQATDKSLEAKTEKSLFSSYLELLDRKKTREAELIKRIEEEDAKLKKVEKEIELKSGEIKATSSRASELKKTLASSKDEYINSITDNEFISEFDYRKGLMEEEKLEELSKDIRNYKERIKFLRTSLENLSKNLGDSKKVDLESIENDLKQKNNHKTELENNKNNLKISNNKIEESTSSIREHYESNRKAIDAYEKIKDLADVANRQNNKNASFEAYVLSTYLDEILEFTNQRFNKMTDGRYEIFRKEEISSRVSESGLDLEVLDYYSSKRRDISTLSGGESFKASLSMALGLSDVVKMYSGGVGLDTIFIDEGFGTLDSESLDMAIDTLVEIQNQGRLVGIISHVEELKERIPDKIEIETTTEGSTIKAFES